MTSPTNSFDPFKLLQVLLIAALIGRSCYLLWDLQFDDGLIMLGIAFLLISIFALMKFFISLAETFIKMVSGLQLNKDTTDHNNGVTLGLISSMLDALNNMDRNMKVMVTYLNQVNKESSKSLRITMTHKNDVKQEDDLSQDELQELLNAALEKEDYLEAERLKKLMQKKENS